MDSLKRERDISIKTVFGGGKTDVLPGLGHKYLEYQNFDQVINRVEYYYYCCCYYMMITL